MGKGTIYNFGTELTKSDSNENPKSSSSDMGTYK